MRFATYFLNLILLVGVTGMAYGQSNAPLASTPGAPSGSYKLDNFDTVNLFSGNLNIALPLAGLNGRGETGIGVSLNIEDQWQINEIGELEFEISNKPVGIIGSVGSVSIRSNLVGPQDSCTTSAPHYWWDDSLNVTVVLPDGTEQILIDPHYKGKYRQCSAGPPNANYGNFFQSVDGTFTTFVADANVYSIGGALGMPIESPVSGYLYRKDGSETRVENGKIVWIQDRNGNKSSFSYPTNSIRPTNLKDSLGREIQIEYSVTEPAPYGYCHKITIKGSNGEDRIIRVSLGMPLRNPVSGTDDEVVLTELITTDPYDSPQIRGNFTDGQMPKAVWLPDGRAYEFKYNPNGRIAEITLPTGGKVEYDFYPSIPASPNQYSYFINRVKEKRVFDENDALVSKTLFTTGTNGSAPSWPNCPTNLGGWCTAQTVVTVENKDSANNLMKKSRHYFYGNADSRNPFLSWAGQHWWGTFDGKERMTEELDIDGTSVLVRTERTLRPKIDAACYYDPNMENPCNLPSYPHVPNSSPMVVETKTTLVDSNQVSVVSNIDPTSQVPALDSFNNFTDTWVYDFGAGQKGSLLKRTHTDYVTSSSYTSIHLRSLPLQTWVSSDSAGNNKVSRTIFEYDNYTTDSNHAGPVSRSNVVGHDTTNYGTGFAYRGNVTGVTSYADAQAQAGAISAYSQYDILGNVVKVIDAKGCASTSNYDDNFGAPDGEAQTNTPPSQLNGLSTFAFPKNATNCMGWITGYSQVDYFTGASVNTEDINGVISKTIYNDPLDRPTQSVSAIGTDFERQSNIVYDDANRRIETKSDLFALDDNLLKSESFYDGLGRTFESRAYKDGGYVVSKTDFDALGRVKRVTNPYRPHLSEQELWTESFYDALGRIIKVKTPDNAEALTSYSGNTVTVTDQAGKQRRSITNALGQLVRVDEPNAAGQLGTVASPNQPTYYSYNTLGKMVKVNQGVQNRYFMYDSLGRMLRVRQPEQEINTILNTSGNPENNSWSAGFTYDNNGNVSSAIDAENTEITNTYDSLNRVLTTTYSDGTPTVTNHYDGTGLPSVPANSKGKLTKVSSSISESKYTEFDVIGRLKQFQQYTDGQTYTSKYTYNLSGALIEEEYPSGRKVRNDFDVNGNISRIHGIANPTATEKTYATSFSYFADGRIEKLKLGNGLWESAKVNARLQVTELAVGYSVGNGGLMKLNYEYGELQTNGTVDALMNAGHIAKQTLSFDGLANPFIQSFTYDSLYRLKEAKETSNSNQTWKQVFDYDRYGNRTTHERYTGTTLIAFDATTNPEIDDTTNRFESDQGYTFDKNGNVIIDGQGRQFTFNGDNKQTQVRDSENNVVGTYFYDGEGKRIKKVTNSETTVFVYSGGKLIAEYSTATPPPNPTTSYTITDQLGSPRVIVDALGQVVSRRDFLPFGEEVEVDGTYRTPNQKYGQNDSVRQRFTGYQKDEETQLDFAEARMYENRHARFTAIDPLLASGKSANPQTFNRYVYVLNNPIILVDVNGEFPISIYVRAFAPYNWFGPGWAARGDGANRPFSTSFAYTSRIYAETSYETTGKNESVSRAVGSQSETRYGICPACVTNTAYSNAYFLVPNGNTVNQRDSIHQGNYERYTGEGNVNYHLAGKDRAFIPGMAKWSPTWDIDVRTNLRISTTQDGTTRMNLTIAGQVRGDQFPAAEAFVKDAKGNAVFLGVFRPSNMSTPATTLAGAGDGAMISVNVTIVTNRQGTFIGVRQGDKVVSLEAWNKQFTQQRAN